MKIYNVHCQGEKHVLEKMYILEKKEKANLVILIEKIKRHAIGWLKEKKTSLGLLSYKPKSAQ